MEKCGNCVRGLINGTVCEVCHGTALINPVVEVKEEKVEEGDAIEKESAALEVDEDEEKPKINKKK